MLSQSWQPAAVADNGTAGRTKLAADKDFAESAAAPVEIVSRTLTMSADESRHVRARLEATSPTTAIVGMTARIKCVVAGDTTDTAVGVTAASARNHEGYDTTTYATPGHLPVYADLLFTAPAAGTYKCGLYGSTYASSTDGYSLTAVADSTWIETSDSAQKGAHWWQSPACPSGDTNGECTYVGDGTANPDTFVFYDDGTPAYKWPADATATSIDALADVELTTCYIGTASCAASMQEYARGTNAKVTLTLQLIQLDATGHSCRTTEQEVTRTITDDAHHYVANLSLSGVAFSSACDTRNFVLRVHVEHIEGQTVKVDGVQGSGTSLTNAIAMNRFA
ncbi:hypothetical protein ACIA6D_29770 [Streptomyces cacaoi]